MAIPQFRIDEHIESSIEKKYFAETETAEHTKINKDNLMLFGLFIFSWIILILFLTLLFGFI
jgi:hypothetical protein